MKSKASKGRREHDKELKLAFSEFYLSLILLQNYSKFNQLGFKKIMKKFDKNIQVEDGSRWMKKVKNSKISDTKIVDNLVTQVDI